jgi:hypothetical protein
MEDVSIFHGHLGYFSAILYIFWPFGIIYGHIVYLIYGHLVYFYPIYLATLAWKQTPPQEPRPPLVSDGGNQMTVLTDNCCSLVCTSKRNFFSKNAMATVSRTFSKVLRIAKRKTVKSRAWSGLKNASSGWAWALYCRLFWAWPGQICGLGVWSECLVQKPGPRGLWLLVYVALPCPSEKRCHQATDCMYQCLLGKQKLQLKKFCKRIYRCLRHSDFIYRCLRLSDLKKFICSFNTEMGSLQVHLYVMLSLLRTALCCKCT